MSDTTPTCEAFHDHEAPNPSSLDVSKHLQVSVAVEPLVYSPPRDEYRCCPASPLELTWRHSGWAAHRKLVWDAMVATGAGASRLDRFAQCGSAAYILANAADGSLRLSANFCHDRLCVPCAVARSAIITHSLVAAAAGQDVRFATLTLRHADIALSPQINRLYESFRRLRQTKWWKDRCRGGAAVMELKVGRDNLWHVHLHCLLLGSYMDQSELSEKWHEITGDSFMVDIRKVQNEAAIRYVGSYAGKPLDGSIYRNAERLREFIVAVKGRRLVNCWGDWQSIKFAAGSDDAPLGVGWYVVGSLSQLVSDARCGDKAAQVVLDNLWEQSHAGRQFRSAGAPPPAELGISCSGS